MLVKLPYHIVTWYDVMIWYMSEEVFHESATLCVRIGGILR